MTLKLLTLIRIIITISSTSNFEYCQPSQAILSLGNSYRNNAKPTDENAIVVFHTVSECPTAYVTV
jgi:hypothetical protein